MKQTIKIACIQTELVWENAEANRQHFANKIKSISEPVDIIVLPEMFTTGFSMRPKPLAEPMSGATVEWMKTIAEKSNAVIAGSVIILDDNNHFNRFLWVEPSGNIQFYDKRHLFSLAGEDNEYTAGDEIVIVDFHGWKINLNVCYDLRFPVWSRNTTNHHVAIYVANWPKPRAHAWSSLLRARAIENQCFVIGVNRVGEDANKNEYSGQSVVIDMEGSYSAEANERDTIIYAEFDSNKYKTFRERYPFFKDSDDFELK